MNKIEDVCLVGDGAHASIKRCKEGYLYLTAKNFNSNGLDLSSVEFISEEDYKKHFCKKTETVLNVQEGDLVFSIIGSIGRPYVVKEHDVFGLSSSVAILRPNMNKILSSFLYYWISTKTFQTYVMNIKSGAAQGFLSLGMIKKLPVLLLPLPTQQKIVNVLSTYDKLIENNNRRINLLKKAAQEIYKEWFVRFRFPGYKSCQIKNGIPEGWEIIKVKDLVKRLPFGTLYKAENVSDTGKVIVIDQSRKDYLGFHNNEPSHIASMEKPIILFGDHTCKMKFMVTPFSLSENVIPLVSRRGELSMTFLYFLINSLVSTKEYKRHWGELTSKKVLLPTKDLQKEFEKKVLDNLVLINILEGENRNLTIQRDLLLPRLMHRKLGLSKV